MLTAKRHLAKGDTATACAEIAQVNRLFHQRASYLLLARSCADIHPSPDAPPLERMRWEAPEWTWRHGIPSLGLVAAAPGHGLVVSFQQPMSRATLVVLQWDGRDLAPLAVETGATEARFPVEAEAGPHLAELRGLSGPPPAPATTTLE